MLASSNGAKQSAEHLKSQIQTQKNRITSLQKQIDQVNQSIRFASHTCAGPRCVQWNERQREKQQQVEQMQAQLDGRRSVLMRCKSPPANKVTAIPCTTRSWKVLRKMTPPP